ncbi:MAG TPA: alpha/beta hydrolase [Bryobacteraceae bacterium]|nr:alpha/beta hydrolase [Bryobacteraceae bacterium]
MSGQSHLILPERRSRMARWAGYVAGILVLAACAGALYQQIGGMLDRRFNPPPGRFVLVDGLRMHLVCTGQGSPTVVLDSGLSNTWLHWYKVQPEVAKFTRVCSYDRAGLGWSDPWPGPRTSKVIAQELHVLLRNAGVAPPFVLVGHSIGGLNMQMYASLYRSEVSGMVLVDSVHADQNRFFGAEYQRGSDYWTGFMKRNLRLMPFGIPRLLGWCGTALADRRAEFRAFDCTAQQVRGWLAEEAGSDASAAQVRATGPFGDLPLVVVSRGPENTQQSFLKVWYTLQVSLAQRSTRGRRVIAERAGHDIHLDRPDVVIAAIRDVWGESLGARLGPL